MTEPLQPNLPSLPMPQTADAAIFAPSQHGIASANDLFAQEPERYALVLELRSRGMGQLRIAKELSMGIMTVRAVLEREGRSLFAPETDNPNAIRLMREGRELALERTIEALQDDRRAGKMTPDRLAVTVGILTQNAELLSGNATSRIEHVHDAPPAADEFANYLKQGAIEAEVIETGIQAGDGETKGAPALIWQGDADVDAPGDPGADEADQAAAAVVSGEVHKMNDQVETCGKANDSACSGDDDVNRDVTGCAQDGADGGAGAVPGEGSRVLPAAPGSAAPGGEGAAHRKPATT